MDFVGNIKVTAVTLTFQLLTAVLAVFKVGVEIILWMLPRGKEKKDTLHISLFAYLVLGQ